MSWKMRIKNLIRHWKKPNEPVFVGEQVPVNQSLEFTNHTLFTTEIFSFLEEEHDFSEPSSQWFSREFSTLYENGHVTIKVTYESSTLPHVTISKGIKGAPGSSYHDVAALDTEGRFRSLYAARSCRLEPKNDRYLDQVMHDNMYDRREIHEDYLQWGRAEHEKMLCLYANLIKTHSEMLTGNFTSFSSTSRIDQENSSEESLSSQKGKKGL